MKRILVTGGAGKVGRAAVTRLVSAGYTVKVIGLEQDILLPDVENAVCDILDYAALRAALRGCEAVVHLAAVATPGLAASEVVFQTNVQGTFNVFHAAEEEGIQRVVQASSINAVGMYYGRKPAPLHYLPLDEEHPAFGTDAYSFSKHIIEEIGEYFWRRAGISSVALRFPYVVPADGNSFVTERNQRTRAFTERLQNYSPAELRAWFEPCWEKFNAWRALGSLEDPDAFQKIGAGQLPLPAEDFSAMLNRVNFFTMVDERDAAQALQRGLEVEYGGSQALFITDSQNWMGLPSRLLARLFYPDVQTFKTPLEGRASLVSIERARQLLGYQVEHSFGA